MMTRTRLLLQRNLPGKIIALVAAVCLWLFVMNEQNPSIDGSFTVRLSVVNAPEGYKITHEDDSIKLKVRGPHSLFVSADANDFRAYVDLAGAESGKQTLKVKAVLPPGFELVETQPGEVSFTLDKIVQKQIEAEVLTAGALAPGMTVAKMSQAVKTVTIEGPESAVNQVSRVIGYVSLSGNNADFSLMVPLTAVDSEDKVVDEVKVVPQTTPVSVQLARGLTKKVVLIKPVLAEDLLAGYQIGKVKVDPARIEIAGETGLIDAITTINTEPISLADVTKSTKKTVKLELPEGITVTNKDVNVTIEVSEKKKE